MAITIRHPGYDVFKQKIFLRSTKNFSLKRNWSTNNLLPAKIVPNLNWDYIKSLKKVRKAGITTFFNKIFDKSL